MAFKYFGIGHAQHESCQGEPAKSQGSGIGGGRDLAYFGLNVVLLTHTVLNPLYA